MKTRITTLFLLPMLIAVLGLMLAGPVTAQTFTTLHSFSATSGPYPSTNSDGVNPSAGLITNFLGNTLYGTSETGGSSGNGTVFAVNTNGTSFTNLHSFTAYTTNSFGQKTNSDGANPSAGLVLSGNTLYGTAQFLGSSGAGTVFAVNTDGTGFTNLHNLHGPDGVFPNGLILSSNTLYGTAVYGGTLSRGRCSPSTPMVRVLRTCTVSRHPPPILLVSIPIQLTQLTQLTS